MKPVNEPVVNLYHAYSLAKLLSEKRGYVRIIKTCPKRNNSAVIYNVEDYQRTLKVFETAVCKWVDTQLYWCNRYSDKDVEKAKKLSKTPVIIHLRDTDVTGTVVL